MTLWQRPRRRLGLLPAVMMVIALSGCGNSESAAPSSGLTNAQFNYLAGNALHGTDQSFLFRANQLLTERCMNRRGFRYYPAQQAPLPPVVAAENELSATGKAPAEARQLAVRAQVGYGIVSSAEADHADPNANVPQNDTYVQSLPAAEQNRYMKALDGSGSRSCSAQVDDEIYGSTGANTSITQTPERVLAAVVTATQADVRVIAAERRWVRCFRRKTGRHFATGDAVAAWLEHEFGHETLSRLRDTEIRYSLADTRCRYSTGLAQTYSRALRQHANELTASEQGSLLAAFELRRRAVARAEKLLQNIT